MKWRYSSFNPRYAFCCVNCQTAYRFRVKTNAQEESDRRRMQSRYRLLLLRLWVIMLIVLGASISLMTVLLYYADDQHKNIPVAARYVLTSVAHGFPDENNTAIWREEYKSPEVKVWPYYTLFAVFLISIIVLLLFCFCGCTFDERERGKRCQVCNNCAGSCSNNCNCYIYYPCPNSGSCGSGGGCCDCNVPDLNCGNCGGGNGEAGAVIGVVVLMLVILLIVAVLISALFVVIAFAIHRSGRLYDRLSLRAEYEAEEEWGIREVLGRDEAEGVYRHRVEGHPSSCTCEQCRSVRVETIV
jgi:hypothetical protein